MPDEFDESVEAMRLRHLKVYRVIQGRALAALNAMPLDNPSNIVRALSFALDGERRLRCESEGVQPELDLEDLVRRSFRPVEESTHAREMEAPDGHAD